MCVKLGHAKFQPFTPRETFSNWGLNEGWEEKSAFSNGKLARLYLGNGEIYDPNYY